MSTLPALVELLRQSLLSPGRGVIGLVDNLLTVCPEQDLHLDWQDDRCRVRSSGEDPEEIIDVPLRKSVFRAMLARVAVVCNEQAPNAVSPYGGEAEITVSAEPTAVFRVAFTNTPGEQKLEVTRVSPKITGQAGRDAP